MPEGMARWSNRHANVWTLGAIFLHFQTCCNNILVLVDTCEVLVLPVPTMFVSKESRHSLWYIFLVGKDPNKAYPLRLIEW
jgi:hypothetical protein